ncbi:MAG: serine hydrolase domain-containing protein [Acidobacteriota bacterium]
MMRPFKSSAVESVWIVFAAVALCRLATAGEPASTSPGARADSIFEKWDRSNSPGCAVAVYRDGKIIYERGYGMANLELGVRIGPQTVFDVGSTSKQFTSMSILLLSRDGKLSLDDDVRKFLPEIPDYGDRITIRHLLHHTSGIRDYLELLMLEGFRDEDLTDDDDALKVIARQRALNFRPGDEHLYSNSGYFLLSVIVKRVSGKSLREFAEERIFGPLGMIHTQVNDDHQRIIPNRATGYDEQEGGGGFAISMSDYEQTGDGAVLTSVEDLLLWDRNFYEPIVGDRALIDEMLAPGKLNSGEVLEYAKGLAVDEYRGLKTVSHGGAWAGYRAELLRFPEQKLSVACLCNFGSTDPEAMAQKVAEVYLGEQMKPMEESGEATGKPAVTLSPADLSKLAGAYRNPKTGTVWMLTVEDGVLQVDTGSFNFRLVPASPSEFRAQDAPVEIDVAFVAAATGQRPQMVVQPAGRDKRFFDPLDPWAPTAAALAQFAGSYSSDEIGTAFRFEVADGKLYLRHRTLPDRPLRPTTVDGFNLGPLSFTFTRDSKKRADGFSLSMGRVKNITFRRAL